MTAIGRMLAGVAMLGWAATGTAQQAPVDEQALERAFDAQINSADQLSWLKDMSSAPNHVGGPHDRANAEMQLALFKQWGWDAHIETFQVLYPTPVSTTLELIAPERVTLSGQEPAVAEDPSSHDLSGALPPYVAYQGDGDVTAPVVYVNYGLPGDYDALAARGIEVRGKIVIARYGGGWRGLKPRLAQEHGAVGCLIYSDPADDGYTSYDTYPRGGGRPASGVQRGSVQDMTQYPGDPLTPGVGATAHARRLTRATAPTILKIPALPISYADATRIMAGLHGPIIAGRGRGALGIAYHWGGTDAVRVHLAVKSDWSLKPIYDVIATMRGAVLPDQWIIRGNHHDGWVFGASDPLTGQVALMSEAKALGALAKTGWRPARTIVYASWDGEEPGLLGSTEWAETHADELKKHALLYINTDNNGRGFLHAEGSHDLQHFVNSAARDVIDPQTDVDVLARLRASVRTDAYTGDGRGAPSYTLEAARAGGDMPLGALGSGSDYSAFLQHLGIAALDLGFGGEDASAGSYHSAYDSFWHVTHFDDPGLAYGAALSKLTGRIVLRAADGPRVPSRYGDFAATVARYIGEVKKLAADQRDRDRALGELRTDAVFRLASNPEDPTVAPTDRGVTPLIDMLTLEDASDRLARAAHAADAAFEKPTVTGEQRSRMAAMLADIDQTLTDDRGLPGRPWYRNLIYAPGTLTGYGAKTLPGIREGIEQRRFADAQTYVGRTAAVLDAYAARLEAAAAIAK